jgi:hypothetical protein
VKDAGPTLFGGYRLRATLSDERLLARSVDGTVVVMRRVAAGHRAWAVQHGLDHPGVVPIVDTGTDASGRAWLVMPVIRGLSLTRLVHRLQATGQRFSVAAACRLTRDVLMAIAAYQRSETGLHGAIGPDTVLVTFRGDSVLLDDGTARGELARRGELGDPSADVAATIRLFAALLEPHPRVPSMRAESRLDLSSVEAPLPVRAWLEQSQDTAFGPRELAQRLETACPALLEASSTQELVREALPGLDVSFNTALAAAADPDTDTAKVEQLLSHLGRAQPMHPATRAWPSVVALVCATLFLGAVAWHVFCALPAPTVTPPAPPETAALARAEQLLAAGDISLAMVALRQCRLGDAPCPRAAAKLTELERTALAQRQPDPLPMPAPPLPECDPLSAQRLLDQLAWDEAAAELRNCFEPGTSVVTQAAQERLGAIARGAVERCLLQQAQTLLGRKHRRSAHWLVHHVQPSAALTMARNQLLLNFRGRPPSAADEFALFALNDCLKRHPNSASGWLLLGEATEMLEPARARNAYDRFLQLAPPDHPARQLVRERLDRLLR